MNLHGCALVIAHEILESDLVLVALVAVGEVIVQVYGGARPKLHVRAPEHELVAGVPNQTVPEWN